MNTDRWVTLSQAVIILGKSMSTIQRVIKKRNIETKRQGREMIVNLAELWDEADAVQHGGDHRRVGIDSQ